MKQHLESLIQVALKQLEESGELKTMPAMVNVEAAKGTQHGDFASNIAMVLAKAAQKKPRDIAELIIRHLPASTYVLKAELAGPGFINFYLSAAAISEVLATVITQKEQFGYCKIGRNKKVLIEFLSSNPTGPLHVGHGRHAAFGAVVANLLAAVGFNVYREYYVNDAGRQMNILTVSIWIRYLIICGETINFPANAYQGHYIIAIAQALFDAHAKDFWVPKEKVIADLPADEPEGGDKEIYIDAVIERAKTLLADKYDIIFELGCKHIVADMRSDLAEFGVHYDSWFSEKEFVATGAVQNLLTKMQESGHTYEQDQALWFRSTDFGDEKDRVLVRSNGQYTYFAPDIAYHFSKFERGFDIAIDIFGSDHHGYLPRMKAAMQALGINPERLILILVQFVSLYRGGKPAQMSTRGGNFVTLRELREEVGNDAARYFYVMRKNEQPMDFDLDLAKAKSNENPVYYVQYAHARICSVFKQLADRNMHYDQAAGITHLDLLTATHERQLINTISRYPDMIVNAALHYEPQQLTNYLRDLAADFHAYYNSQQFIVEDEALRNARLVLISAARQTLVNGFNILGISAPESM